MHYTRKNASGREETAFPRIPPSPKGDSPRAVVSMGSWFASVRCGRFRHVALLCITLLGISGAPGERPPAAAALRPTVSASVLQTDAEQSASPEADVSGQPR